MKDSEGSVRAMVKDSEGGFRQAGGSPVKRSGLPNKIDRVADSAIVWRSDLY